MSDYDYEQKLKAVHKVMGRTHLMEFIGNIAVRHDPIFLKGKGNIQFRCYAEGLKSSYYQGFMRRAVDSQYRRDNLHCEKVFTWSKGAHSYFLVFNKEVYEEVRTAIYHLHSTLNC